MEFLFFPLRPFRYLFFFIWVNFYGSNQKPNNDIQYFCLDKVSGLNPGIYQIIREQTGPAHFSSFQTVTARPHLHTGTRFALTDDDVIAVTCHCNNRVFPNYMQMRFKREKRLQVHKLKRGKIADKKKVRKSEL